MLFSDSSTILIKCGTVFLTNVFNKNGSYGSISFSEYILLQAGNVYASPPPVVKIVCKHICVTYVLIVII